MEIFSMLITIWALQAWLACMCNMFLPARIPRNPLDFLLLTFLPFVIIALLFSPKWLE